MILQRFVTLDSTMTKEEIFSILSNLRTQSILGEPVKARLKTKSSSSTLASFERVQISNVTGITIMKHSISPSIGWKPLDEQPAQGSFNLGKDSYTYGNKMHHHPKHQHQPTTATVTEKFQARKTFGAKETGGSKVQRNHGRNKRGAQNSIHHDTNGKEKHENDRTSFASLADKDFPSLGDLSSTKATLNVSPAEHAKKSNDANSSMAASPIIPYKVASGYAAALLKPAAVNPTIPSTTRSSVNTESKVRIMNHPDCFHWSAE